MSDGFDEGSASASNPAPTTTRYQGARCSAAPGAAGERPRPTPEHVEGRRLAARHARVPPVHDRSSRGPALRSPLTPRGGRGYEHADAQCETGQDAEQPAGRSHRRIPPLLGRATLPHVREPSRPEVDDPGDRSRRVAGRVRLLLPDGGTRRRRSGEGPARSRNVRTLGPRASRSHRCGPSCWPTCPRRSASSRRSRGTGPASCSRASSVPSAGGGTRSSPAIPPRSSCSTGRVSGCSTRRIG